MAAGGFAAGAWGVGVPLLLSGQFAAFALSSLVFSWRGPLGAGWAVTKTVAARKARERENWSMTAGILNGHGGKSSPSCCSAGFFLID